MVLIYDANETFLLYLGILDLAFVFFFVVDVDVDESAHRWFDMVKWLHNVIIGSAKLFVLHVRTQLGCFDNTLLELRCVHRAKRNILQLNYE